ncbi:hypothetical protein Tco_0365308 [Tanacetum coccineum]
MIGWRCPLVLKMRQYIPITDHILWDIITNGDQATTEPASSSDRHLLSFHDAQDAQSLWAAIKARFGGNKESKKMQKNLLKQQFETFVVGARGRLRTQHTTDSRTLLLLCLETHDDETCCKIYDDAMEEMDIDGSSFDNCKNKKVHEKTEDLLDLKPKMELPLTSQELNA